jgi:hypothetical protein
MMPRRIPHPPLQGSVRKVALGMPDLLLELFCEESPARLPARGAAGARTDRPRTACGGIGVHA